jgi:phosphatidyl-myo-inositol dimannoside synthase
VTGRVLLLTPSRGLGGGIERFADTLEGAFAAESVDCVRVDLRRPGAESSRMFAHARMLAESRRHLRSSAAPTRLVVMHRALLPVATLAARRPSACGISVICHGSDAWGARLRPRGSIENHLMGRRGVRVVAVSNFTAGAISRSHRATVLPPGLSCEWFRTLAQSYPREQAHGAGYCLVTAFRLADWKGKGLPQLLDAVAALGRLDVRVIVCGTGEPPQELDALVRECGCCTLRPGLTDRELARQFAAADLFVLATRTRTGRQPSGEGFGLALLEAQLAGTPVIGPAYGGSHDAFVDQVTGVAPADETTAALAGVLETLLRNPERLAWMGKRAAEWARERYAPDSYATRVVARLL